MLYQVEKSDFLHSKCCIHFEKKKNPHIFSPVSISFLVSFYEALAYLCELIYNYFICLGLEALMVI